MSILFVFPVPGLQTSTDSPQGLLQSELWRLCDQQSHSALCKSLFGGNPGGPTLAESTQESEQFRDSLILPAVYEHLGSIPGTQPLQAPGFSRYAAVPVLIGCKLALFLFSTSSLLFVKHVWFFIVLFRNHVDLQQAQFAWKKPFYILWIDRSLSI